MPEYRVTDPETGRTMVLTGESPPTEEELDEVFSSMSDYQPPTNFQEGVADDVSMFSNIAEGGARGFVDNAMMLPNAIGDVLGTGLAAATAGVQTVGSGIAEGIKKNISTRPNFDMVTGEPFNFRDELSSNYEAARNTFPASTLIGGYNAPTSIDMQAGLSVAPEFLANADYRPYPGSMLPIQPQPERELTDIGQMFADERDEILEGVMERRAAHPIGAGAGDVLGDVMTVLAGRAPIVKAKRSRQLANKKKPAEPTKEYSDNWKGFADRKADQYKEFFKGSGYDIAETGIEGAVLAALQDEDPIIGMMAGAGLQAGTNMIERAWSDLDDIPIKPGTVKTGTKLGISAMAMSTFLQAIKELTPGGRDRILESEESGYKKAAATMAVMAMMRAGGFGRPSEQQLNQLGFTVDAWHSMRRSSVLSLISEIENDDSGDLGRVQMQLAQDPSYFGTTALRRLDRAFTNEDVSAVDTIESLMEADRKFRRRVIDLRNKVPEAFPSLRFERTREMAEDVEERAKGMIRENL